MADTDRLNRAIGLPSVHFIPSPIPRRKGHYQASLRLFGFSFHYEEFPFDWVEGRYYKVLRRFQRGPIEQVTSGIRLRPLDGVTELEVFAEVIPKGLISALLARVLGRAIAIRDVLKLSRRFERYFQSPYVQLPAMLPPKGLVNTKQTVFRLSKLKEFPVDPGLADKLKDSLLTGSDLDVMRIRPFELADQWGRDRLETLKLCLFAAKSGLLDLTWNVLCPNCRAVSSKALTLSQLKSQVHCDTCQITFGADLASSIEARFAVNPAVRMARQATYCIGGPANMPQIVVQWRLQPGERRQEEIGLRPGRVRARCFQTEGIVPIDVDDAGESALGVRCGKDGLWIEKTRLSKGSVVLEAMNALEEEALLVIERETWREGAATAALVTSLQDFRDLFPAEAVAPGEDLGIASLTLLFTDLSNSTSLYEEIGDARAFGFVQNHFRYLTERVSGHRGGLVKTMGDAVMASFANPKDALEAALQMQRDWSRFLKEYGGHTGVSLKVGLHQGPCMAINNKGKLDYFGATVNIAARVQSQASGGDIVLTQAIQEDPEVQQMLKTSGVSFNVLRVPLKGVKKEQILYRVFQAH